VGEDLRRVGLNESTFRAVNEQIEELGETSDASATEFVCECADAACTARVSVPLDTYEEIRADPGRFLVAAGHQQADAERVVEDHGDYLIVQKFGEAGEVAQLNDPRS
jgi:hypothetical protein